MDSLTLIPATVFWATYTGNGGGGVKLPPEHSTWCNSLANSVRCRCAVKAFWYGIDFQNPRWPSTWPKSHEIIHYIVPTVIDVESSSSGQNSATICMNRWSSYVLYSCHYVAKSDYWRCRQLSKPSSWHPVMPRDNGSRYWDAVNGF